MHRLKQASLNKTHIAQLQKYVLDMMMQGHAQAKEYGKLGRVIADQPFRMAVNNIVQTSDNQRVVKQAQQMLNYIDLP
jgi:hypothetical protein